MKYKDLFSFSKKEVNNAFNKSKAIAQINGLKLLFNPISNFKYGKLLIITSRKTGKAHLRNKIRRQIKEIFYKNQLFNKQGTYIILIYSQALELTFNQLKEFLTINIK